jgi:tetratricopeptide (TPR) repeat protein
MTSSLHSILEQAREADKAGNHSLALMNYRLYLKHETRDPQAWADYGGLLFENGRFEDSLQACFKALEIEPGFESALINKAAALVGLDRMEEAKDIYKYLLSINPDNNQVIIELQKCLYKMKNTASIEDELLRILDTNQNNIEALTVLISIYLLKNDHDKIKLYWEKLINIKFKDDEALCEKSHLYLLLGEFQDGFKLYEHRKKANNNFTSNGQRWAGEPFPGRTLFLYWEQGFGDTIMMLRYGALVKAMGGTVVLQVQGALAELAKTCAGFDHVVTNQDTIPKYDLQLPLMSLPLALGTDINTVPANIPYLSVPQVVPNKEAIIVRLNQSDKLKKIGLVWAGSKEYSGDDSRSISPELLKPFEKFQGAAWYSLQREAPDLVPFNGITPMADLMDTFADTAFVISNMDLIVAVDTAIAHLAGALGKPVALMLPFSPDWRWMLNRGDSPWYPTVRIYRLASGGNWEDVVNSVVNDCGSIIQNIAENIILYLDNADFLVSKECFNEAAKIYKKILSLDPNNIQASLALGKILLNLGSLEAAQDWLEHVTTLDPNNNSALEHLLVIYIQQGDFDRSEFVYDKMVDINYIGNKRNFERGIGKLLHGKLKEGFELDQTQTQLIKGVVQHPKPQWGGGRFDGQVLLLYWDRGGFGDVIQVLRYGPIVKALGGRVVLQVQAPLVDLAKTCAGFDEVVSANDPPPHFDLQLPLLSLPFVLGTDIDNVPGAVPYMGVPEQVQNKNLIDSRIALARPSLRGGVTWSGNPNFKRQAHRSIPDQLLIPLGEIEHIVWYSFLREEPGLLPIPGMVPVADLLGDFSDTAYALSKMDFVVSVDTALAHLAGALGKPMFLVIPFMPDWRWMLGRSDSPWYPTMEIFRHPSPGNCAAAVQALKQGIIESAKSLPLHL